MQPRALAFLLSVLLLFAAGAARADEIPAAVQAAVDAPDRAADDRALDAGRKPAELLAFLGIRPGLRVAELGAGGGYTAELLARVVGPDGPRLRAELDLPARARSPRSRGRSGSRSPR